MTMLTICIRCAKYRNVVEKSGERLASPGKFWDMLAWDDEETATPPYVQIYSDAGCLAVLYYTTPDEHEQALEFARRLMLLNEERKSYEMP